MSSFEVPLPTLEQLVEVFEPELGHKADFLGSFPDEAGVIIILTLEKIVEKYSPGATADREGEVSILYLPPGASMGEICSDLLKECPFIRIKFPNGPSESTIRHLMSCPAKNRLTAKRYKNYVKTKLALGQNNKKQDIPLVLFSLSTSFIFDFFFFLMILGPCLQCKTKDTKRARHPWWRRDALEGRSGIAFLL